MHFAVILSTIYARGLEKKDLVEQIIERYEPFLLQHQHQKLELDENSGVNLFHPRTNVNVYSISAGDSTLTPDVSVASDTVPTPNSTETTSASVNKNLKGSRKLESSALMDEYSEEEIPDVWDLILWIGACLGRLARAIAVAAVKVCYAVYTGIKYGWEIAELE